MIIPSSKDAIHKAWLYRILSEIYDNTELAEVLFFKGGTCASMRGLLDRFSVDLDFDLMNHNDIANTRKSLEKIFDRLGLEIKDSSKNTVQYFLRYDAPPRARNTVKIDATFPPVKANDYENVRLIEIDRIAKCQTVETMFANKLVALIDRFEKNHSIAGRDMYDIHYFFLQGYRYNPRVITERRNTSVTVFFTDLIEFIEKNVTETVINQDLNALLPLSKFSRIRRVLKRETLMFLEDELIRLKNES